MQTQWSRLALYAAVALTLLAILFPPFNIIGGLDEYGFILSGPPGFSEALNQASRMLGPDARRMAGGMHFSIDFVRLLIELAAIWGIYFALRRTVLKPVVA